MRIVFVVLAVLLLVPGWSGRERLPLLMRPSPGITGTPVSIRPDQPGRRRVGALTFVGGVRLRSSDPAFGGFSAMQVVGDRFRLVSDGGGIVTFRMGADWTVRDAVTRDLANGPGTGWEKRDRDSESMAVQHDGSVLIGFERVNAIWRYDAALTKAQAVARPRAMRDWSANSGAEAMTVLADRSVVVFSESNAKRGVPGYAALRFLGDPTQGGTRWHRFRFVAPEGFRVTDAATLPDGRILVLTRRASLPELFTARLQIIDARAIRPGAVVAGRTIAAFEGDVLHDNFEALAIVPERGRTMLWIASDDNQSVFQQSLLLKFRIDLPPA